MRKQIIPVLTFLGLALAQNAWATPPEESLAEESTPTQTSPPEQTDSNLKVAATAKEKKVCKSFPPTGSRIGKKICLSQASWDEMARKAQSTLDTSTMPTSNNRKGE